MNIAGNSLYRLCLVYQGLTVARKRRGVLSVQLSQLEMEPQCLCFVSRCQELFIVRSLKRFHVARFISRNENCCHLPGQRHFGHILQTACGRAYSFSNRHCHVPDSVMLCITYYALFTVSLDRWWSKIF